MTIDKAAALLIIAAAKKEANAAVDAAMPKFERVIAGRISDEVTKSDIKAFADVAQTIKGDKGDKGPQGEKGDKGDQGPQGIPGAKGANGKDGKDGKDAISKDGKDGLNGKEGKDGRNGTNGKDGVGIEEVAISDDGNLYIGLTNGKVLNAGRAKGDDGKPGKDGKTIIGGGGGSSAKRQNVTVSETPPSNPQIGDIWIETT